MLYKTTLEKIVYAICFVMFFLFPTSINRVPHSVPIIILLWAVESALIMFFVWQEKINIPQFLIVLVALAHMILATVIASNEDALYISLARIAPIICFLVMCCTSVKNRINPTFFLKLLDVMCIVLIVWNIMTLIRVQPFIEFVNYFYTQLDTYTATYWSLVNNKPIFTFGVHNFAAIFYLHIFLFCYFAYERYARFRYFLYMMCIWLFTLLLKSSSGIGVFCVMGLFVFKMVVKDKKKLFFILLCGIVVLLLLSQSSFVAEYVRMLTSSANGFAARYTSESNLYDGNWAILERFPLGVGFHIGQPELDIYFADSGYMIYYTMGNVIVLLAFFILIFNYFKVNLGMKMAFVLFMVVILTELSFISFMYDKSLYMYVFEIGFYRSILADQSEKDEIVIGAENGKDEI